MNASTTLPPGLPADAVMATLLALATGREILCSPKTGRMVVVLDDATACELDGDHLDELVGRGWVTVDDDTKMVATTERAAYWLRRWIRTQTPKRRAT